MSSDSRRVGVNTIFNTIGGFSIQLLTIATGVFVARHLGAENFGQLTLAATITGYLTLLTEFGLSTIAIRTVARTGEPERYIYSYLVTRLALALLALSALCGIILIVGFAQETVWLLLAYASTIPLQILKVNWLFYATQNMFLDNVIQVGEKLVYAGCLFSLVFVIKGAILVPIAMAISILAIAVLSWMLFLRISKRPLIWKLDRRFIREMFTQGWPIGVAGAALQTNSNVDSIFVNAYHGDLQTGLYGAAYRLINATITAGTFFTNAVFPLSCKRYHESTSTLKDLIEYSSKLLLLVIVPGVILLSVLNEEIIWIIFGKEYSGSALPFRMLVWAAGIAIICRLYHNTLVACEQQHKFMKIILSTACFNVICNFALIPTYGMQGAAAATIMTELLLLVLTCFTLSRLLNMRIWLNIATVTACGGLASLVFLLPVSNLGVIPLFAIGYLVLTFIFRLWGLREWQLVRTMLGRT